MAVLTQILIGTLALIVCAIWHIYVLTRLLPPINKWVRTATADDQQKHLFRAVSVAFGGIVFSHTVQIYAWATLFWALGALDGYEQTIYFALASYTTLGYGDVVLSPAYRILGAMSSITGLLTFGVSTAFLVGFLAHMGGQPDPDR